MSTVRHVSPLNTAAHVLQPLIVFGGALIGVEDPVVGCVGVGGADPPGPRIQTEVPAISPEQSDFRDGFQFVTCRIVECTEGCRLSTVVQVSPLNTAAHVLHPLTVSDGALIGVPELGPSCVGEGAAVVPGPRIQIDVPAIRPEQSVFKEGFHAVTCCKVEWIEGYRISTVKHVSPLMTAPQVLHPLTVFAGTLLGVAPGDAGVEGVEVASGPTGLTQ